MIAKSIYPVKKIGHLKKGADGHKMFDDQIKVRSSARPLQNISRLLDVQKYEKRGGIHSW